MSQPLSLAQRLADAIEQDWRAQARPNQLPLLVTGPSTSSSEVEAVGRLGPVLTARSML